VLKDRGGGAVEAEMLFATTFFLVVFLSRLAVFAGFGVGFFFVVVCLAMVGFFDVARLVVLVVMEQSASSDLSKDAL
jgi:hypothetical protein